MVESLEKSWDGSSINWIQLVIRISLAHPPQRRKASLDVSEERFEKVRKARDQIPNSVSLDIAWDET